MRKFSDRTCTKDVGKQVRLHFKSYRKGLAPGILFISQVDIHSWCQKRSFLHTLNDPVLHRDKITYHDIS